MAFSTDLAKLLSDQLARLATLNRHQLAGRAANLDFWLDQARNALVVIDGYGVRFVRMAGARERYVTAHQTVELAPQSKYHTEPPTGPPHPGPGIAAGPSGADRRGYPVPGSVPERRANHRSSTGRCD
jgi:hypothetical protein